METSATTVSANILSTSITVSLLKKVMQLQGEMAVTLINSAKVETPSGNSGQFGLGNIIDIFA
jgi:hypothetical protein